jgi:hypothetical protein
MTWFLARDNQRYGPYAISQLIKLAEGGNVQPTDLVWAEGMPNWVEARTLPELFPAGAASAGGPRQEYLASGAGMFFQPGVSPSAAAFWSFLWLQIRRVCTIQLRTLEVSPAERKQLSARGIEEETAQRFLVWRRSVFLVVAVITMIAALWSTLALIEKDVIPHSGFGWVTKVVRILSLYAMPAAAILAAVTWTRHKRSRAFILWGWGISFLVPIVIALFPMHLLVAMKGQLTEEEREGAKLGLGFIAGIWYYILLLPTVLSLTPGVMRACLRIKTLLPESIVSGWLLIATSPLHVLLWLVTFVTINQIAGNALLILSIFLFMSAPLVYLIWGKFFIRPLHPGELNKIRIAQLIFSGMAVLAGLLMVIYLFTKTIGDGRLVGFDSETSLVRPWKLIQFYLEYTGRSLFITILVVDLFMLMNLSVWVHTKQFEKSEAAANYDRIMGNLHDLFRGEVSGVSAEGGTQP